MRLLFAGIRPGYPQRSNGASVSTHLLAGKLAESGATVHVLCGRADNSDGAAEADQYRYTIDRAADPGGALEGTVAAFSPDLAILSGRATVDLFRTFERHGIPVVVYQRDLNFELLREARKAASVAPLGVLSCSRFIAEELRARIGVEADYLPNIFPRERYAVPVPGRLVTFVNPVAEKGLAMVLALAERHRDLSFLFVEGWKLSDRQKAALLRRAAAAGNIHWQPRVDDMRPVYARTRVLLVPSRWQEAWGRVVSEAQISGIPVIASDHGGLPESVGDGGILLPPDDVEAWSKKLVEVMTETALWDDLSARAIARSRRAELDPNWVTAQLVCQLHAWMKNAPARHAW